MTHHHQSRRVRCRSFGRRTQSLVDLVAAREENHVTKGNSLHAELHASCVTYVREIFYCYWYTIWAPRNVYHCVCWEINNLTNIAD